MYLKSLEFQTKAKLSFLVSMSFSEDSLIQELPSLTTDPSFLMQLRAFRNIERRPTHYSQTSFAARERGGGVWRTGLVN